MVVPGEAGEVTGLPAARVDVVPEVTPAGGLRHDGAVHQIGTGPPDGAGGGSGKGPVIEEVPVGPVRKAHHVFGVAGEGLVQTAGPV